MPVVVATITPNPGQMEAAESVLKELVAAVHEEDGCDLYALHRGDDCLVFVEKWRDSAALAAHRSNQGRADLTARLAGLLSGGSDVQVLDAIPAGDLTKGVV